MSISEKIILFEDKRDCCACGACENICPTGAITMQEDEYGFVYPHINENLCIKCRSCKRVCAYQNISEENVDKATYVAVTKNTDILKSSSGGVLQVLL